MPQLINPVEMHLKAVLEMLESRTPTRRVRIAERLELSGPTVTKTVLRLERAGLISSAEGSKQLILTSDGFRDAITVMRKHRLAECMLHRIVGLDWPQLHTDACLLEHVMSDRVATLIDVLLDFPASSPYGNPIPSADVSLWDPLGEHSDVSDIVSFLRSTGGERQARIAWIGEPAQASSRLLEKLRTVGATPGSNVFFALHGQSVVLQSTLSKVQLELTRRAASEIFVRV